MSSKGDSISSIRESDIGGKGTKDGGDEKKGTDSSTMIKYGFFAVVALGLMYWVYTNYFKKPSEAELKEKQRQMMLMQGGMQNGGGGMDPRLMGGDPRMMDPRMQQHGGDPRMMDPRMHQHGGDPYESDPEDERRVGHQNMPPNMMYGDPRMQQGGDPRMQRGGGGGYDPRMRGGGGGGRGGGGRGGRGGGRSSGSDDDVGSIPPGMLDDTGSNQSDDSSGSD